MKHPMLALVVLLAIAILAFRVNNEPLPIGSPIPKPDQKLTDVSGKQLTLKDAMNPEGLLVMFSCNTCPVVHANQARTLKIAQYAAEKNIGVILLNSNEGARSDDESLDSMKEYAQGQGYSFYYAVDANSTLADAFGANRTPECFLFDKSAKLVYHGAIDNNPQEEQLVTREHLKIAIDEITGGKDVSIKTSRSVGCSIKRI
jgi:hypothetical protein